jgi:hypothetical protein
MVERMAGLKVPDTKNIGKLETDSEYLLPMQGGFLCLISQKG